MKYGLTKQLNNVFTKFECGICLDLFEAESSVYVTSGDDLVCYDCAKETRDQIEKRIDEKIGYLKASKRLLPSEKMGSFRKSPLEYLICVLYTIKQHKANNRAAKDGFGGKNKENDL